MRLTRFFFKFCFCFIFSLFVLVFFLRESHNSKTPNFLIMCSMHQPQYICEVSRKSTMKWLKTYEKIPGNPEDYLYFTRVCKNMRNKIRSP